MIGSVGGSNPILWYYAATTIILCLFSIYDIRFHIVKNRTLLWFVPWCLISLPIYSYVTGLPMEVLTLRAALGFLNGGLILLTASMATSGGVGGGDIKLAALLGFILGATRVCILLFGACIIALLVILIKNTFTGKQAGRLPFVPFLFAGMLLSLLL